MKITHDKNADALYITFRKGVITHTSKLRNHVIVDTDKNGNIIGIEILRASTQIANKKPIDINLTIPALV
jgi:uncharacterized protein YuzE